MFFSNKDVLIVGASKGLGLSLAKIMKSEGARVFGVSRTKPDQPELFDGYLQLDICSSETQNRLTYFLKAEHFQYDYVFLNSGKGHAGFAQNTTFEEINQLFQVNFFGLLRVFDVVIKEMQKQNKGTVVVTSSLAAYRGLPGSGPYSATKAALTVLFEAYKVDLQATNIKIIQTFPYFVITGMSDPNAAPSLLLWSTGDEAALRIISGIKKGRESIAFPNFFHAIVKFWVCLPRHMYFKFWKFLKKGG